MIGRKIGAQVFEKFLQPRPTPPCAIASSRIPSPPRPSDEQIRRRFEETAPRALARLTYDVTARLRAVLYRRPGLHVEIYP